MLEVIPDLQLLGWFVYDVQVALTGQTFSLLQRVGAIVVSFCIAWTVVEVKLQIQIS